MSTVQDDPNPVGLRTLGFNYLQGINMESNTLSGGFPIWVTQLPRLRREESTALGVERWICRAGGW